MHRPITSGHLGEWIAAQVFDIELFACLDLAADGLTVLFEAEWIARTPMPTPPAGPGLSWETVTDARELGRWETA